MCVCTITERSVSHVHATHEETDTKMHAVDALRNGNQRIVIKSHNTNVHILALHNAFLCLIKFGYPANPISTQYFQ